MIQKTRHPRCNHHHHCYAPYIIHCHLYPFSFIIYHFSFRASTAFSSGLLISILVSPFWNFTDNPSSIARYAYRSVGKSNNSPTAVKHEPSIMPIGGTKKPPTISPTDTKKQMANVMRDMRNVRGSSAFSFLITLAVRVIIVFLFGHFAIQGLPPFCETQ